MDMQSLAAISDLIFELSKAKWRRRFAPPPETGCGLTIGGCHRDPMTTTYVTSENVMHRMSKNDEALETPDGKVTFQRNDSNKSYSKKALSQEICARLYCLISVFPLFVNQAIQQAKHSPR